jgi:predicted lysophospholipase L1 biosynthesis ABC-type transport system permease subunit
VLYSALISTQDERQQEAALMRALGASRAQILASQRTEFAVLGLVAGLLAGAVATRVYCLHCPEMEAPFWGLWYFLGMLVPAFAGLLLGPRLLRW